MINKRRRVQVTLSWPLWELIGEVSDLTDTPKAAVIAELLDEIRPVLEATLEALRVVKERPHEAQRVLSRFGAQAVSDLMQQQLLLDDALTGIDGRTMEGRKARRAARARTPK